MGDLWDIDAHQRELYERAGFDPDEPVLMQRLAAALGIRVTIVRAPAFPGDGALVTLGNEVTIQIRGKVSLERKRFALAHEIAEWALRDIVDEQIETACDALAAALLAPRRAFLRAAYAVGETNFEQLAFSFGLTQTAAALRSAETGGFALALLRPGLLRVRGPDNFVWGSEAEMKRWAAGTPRPGLRKVPITDDDRRTALVVDDEQQLAMAW